MHEDILKYTELSVEDWVHMSIDPWNYQPEIEV